MASHTENIDAEPEDKKAAAVSFSFTKTVNKFKPTTGDALNKNEDKDYLTGIDGKELQRWAWDANAMHQT